MMLKTHPQFWDVAFKTVKVGWYGDKIKAKVLWYNVHNAKHFGGEPFLIDPRPQNLEMTYDKWREFTNVEYGNESAY